MRILVLAGGSDQADLIDLLREKFDNCYIILADMAPKVIASSHADKHLVISTMDFDAMEEMLTNTEKTKEYAGNARKMIASRFERNFVCQCLYDFYDEIM